MAEDIALFADPVQARWATPKKRGGCGRDPEAGPGSCTYWWEGCPKAESRGCFFVWRKRLAEAEARQP